MPRIGQRNALPAIMLFVIILWALAAVVMLTRTLASAVQIENTVDYINTQTTPIDRETDDVTLAGETGVISTDILARADGLSAMFAEIVKSGDGIEASAVAINESAQQINSSVKTIHGSVQSINGIVIAIDSQLTSVLANANSINTSVHQIGGSFDGILGEVITIDARLDRASAQQADPIIGLVRGIKGDTGTIRSLVPQINENAIKIKNAPLLLRSIPLGAPVPLVAAGPVPPLGLPLLPGMQLPALGLPGSSPVPGLLPAPAAPAEPGPLQLPGAGPVPLLQGVGGPLQ